MRFENSWLKAGTAIALSLLAAFGCVAEDEAGGGSGGSNSQTAKGALRDLAGTSGSDFCDGLSLAWFSSGGQKDAEAVVVEVAEASR